MSILFEPDEKGTAPPAANQLNMESKQPAVVGNVVHVVLLLIDGEQVLAGTFSEPADARRSAEELMERFARADGEWLRVDQRYLRPGAVVSIDLVEEEHRRWGGSDDRRVSLGDKDAAA